MDRDQTYNSFSREVLRDMLANSRRTMAMIWAQKRGWVLLLGFIVLAASAIPFLQSGSRALLVNELVRLAGGGTVSSYLVWLLAFVVLASIAPPTFFALQTYVSKLFWFFLDEKFESLILHKRGRLDVAFYEDPANNNLLNRVNESGVWRVQNFVERQFYILQNVIEVAVASVILALAEWWVFLVILAATVPELLTEAKYGEQIWNIHGAKAEIRRRYWNVRNHFYQLSKVVELKLFQNVPHFFSIVAELFRAFQDEQKKADRARLIRQVMAIGISQAAIGFATVWFVLQVARGRLLVGTLLFVLASMGELRQSLSSLFSNLGRHYQDSLFVSDVFRLLDAPSRLSAPAKPLVIPASITPEIAFENLTFAYPGSPVPVLENFSLVLRPGEKFAFVGANGAGKTTFVKLLCRFYDPTKGRILIGGRDLRQVDLESWYAQLGVLFQDYDRYDFKVKEAIAVGRTSQPLSLEEVQDAARRTEADAFIERWPRGYDQQLGKQFDGGIEPSVGQWQKLALARTLYRNPRIFVLDEPTSSIDAEAEAKIFEKLEALPPDRTVILISHRFSTVRRANRIGVIEQGRLIELGTHEELLARQGTYARLFALQARGYR